MRLFALLILLTGIIGCGKTETNGNPPALPAKVSTSPSLAKEAIEGLTGKTAVMQGEQAKDKIRAISADQKNNLNEVLDK